VDYVIPGNDDALRAIRLFASKISDSIAEGTQLATDKQSAELAEAAGAAMQAESAAAEPPAEAVAVVGATATADASGEDINMEEVLGAGTRKKISADPEDAEELPEVSTRAH
jgi:small subunit ribosomal protein S2